MPTRIAFVHTVGFLVETFRGLMKGAHPEADTFHVLNESLLQDLLRGADPGRVYQRVVEQIDLAVQAGAGLVVMTCSSTSPGVDLARARSDVPILKIDDPMAAKAVRAGRRIALLCTAQSTVEPSSALLRAHAAEANAEIRIDPVLMSPAYTALLNGDRPLHDRMVLEAAGEAAGWADVIVLAQASLAPLQDQVQSRVGCPVLASPPLLMEELSRRLAASQGG